MSLGRLVVSITADTAEFQSAIGQAAHIAEVRLKNISDAADKMGTVLRLAFTTGLAGLVYFTRQAVDSADSMYKLAQSAGVGTEAFSELAYAAKLSGLGTEQLSTALSRLNRNISDTAAGTGEARMAFDAMGLSVKNSDGSLKNADQVLTEVSKAFSGMEDGAGKSALAIAIFGRAGAAMIPLLNQGGAGLAALRDEAHKLGQVIDEETGRAAEQFNDTLKNLGLVTSGMANAVMRELLPQMNALSAAMLDGAKSSDLFGNSAQGTKTVFEALAILGANVAFVFNILGKEIGALGASIAAAASGNFQAVLDIQREVVADSEKARAELDAFEKKILGLAGAAGTASQAFRDNWDPSALGNMFKTVAPTILNKDALEAQLVGIKAFTTQYSDAVKTGLALVSEAEKRGELTHEEVIRNKLAADDAVLQTTIIGLQKQEEIYRKLGDLSKTRDAQAKIDAAKAQQQANAAIGEAQLATLEQMENEKAAARADAFNRELSQNVANIELETATERDLLTKRLEEQQAQLELALLFGMVTEEDYRRLREDLELQHQAKMGNITAQGILARKAFEQKTLAEQSQQYLNELTNLTAGVAQHNRAIFEINKVAGIAQAIVNAYVGISKTLAAYPYPFNIAMAAAHAAVAFAQVNAIRSQTFGAGGAAPSLTGTTAATPVSPVNVPEVTPAANAQPAQSQALRQVNIYVEGRTITRDQLEEIANGLNELDADGFPVRFTVAAV